MIDFLNNNITRRTCLLGRRRLLQVRVVQLYVQGIMFCRDRPVWNELMWLLILNEYDNAF